MVKIRFLGACGEVGRSGVLIESEDTEDAVLCDYGKKMSGEEVFPEHVSGKNLSGIVLSHSHVDHCGGIPLFYISGSVPLYCTELTYRVSEILLHDMLKITSQYLPFDKSELFKMRKYTRFLKYGQKKKIGSNTWVTLYDAGHIPGSAMILIEMDGKKILYTGDINTTETQLLKGVNPLEIPQIDAIITETTYGTTDHNSRNETEESFINSVNNVLDNEGIVLNAAFGVSRSQEIALVLTKNKDIPRITLDGMARRISKIYISFSDMLKNPKKYVNSMKKIHFIDQQKRDYERRKASSESGIVIAPSGMLKGGTARYYAENIINGENNAINLVSYQIDGTPGKILLEKGVYIDKNTKEEIKVKAQINHFDFSSHAGKSDLIEFLNKIKFKSDKKVFCVHGDAEVMKEFASNISKLGYLAEIPENGQIFKI
ncbi:MBL fold metallo-hydrolase [Promethearchaeum syntrophicum]|uniref:MBL fold metallo-hydrolase n=1 Tax=Promethearchaeum syntrophicum TaxID=2594042 RepID=A0A5B9D837_9ARCH|nr:MBL fold metallo-hydrolase [Candidatus Prometheoarchaeum syntrophicum]QEE14910.1 Ribonuclease BN [Candidatus Prometheoarchaeum syntrophicum]